MGRLTRRLGFLAVESREPLTVESLKAGRNLMTMHRGAALFKHAVQGMADAGARALKEARLTAADIQWWIPHQANVRIIQDTGALLGIDSSRTVSVVSHYGNSSAANDSHCNGGRRLQEMSERRRHDSADRSRRRPAYCRRRIAVVMR
jgi:3-oxoacyl-[acyl-carrier-protein] synthase-3